MVSVLRPGTFQAVDLTEPSPSNNLNKTSSSEGPNVLDLSRTRDAVAHQVDRSKRSRTQISSAYLRPKVDEKAAGRHKVARPGGDRRKAAESCGLRRGASWRSRPSKCTLPWTPTPSRLWCLPSSYPLWPNKTLTNCSTRGRETAHASTPKNLVTEIRSTLGVYWYGTTTSPWQARDTGHLPVPCCHPQELGTHRAG